MIVRRLALALVLCALALDIGAGEQDTARGVRAAGQALAVYSDGAQGYSFRYPAIWRLARNARTADNLSPAEAALAPTATMLYASDRLAEVAVLVHGGATSTEAIRAKESQLLHDTKASGPLRYSVSTIHGVQFGLSQITFKSSDGRYAYEGLVAGAAHSAYTYYFEAILATNVAPAPVTASRRAQLRAVLASFTFSS